MKRYLLLLLLPLSLFAEAFEWGEQEELPSPPPFYPFSVGGSYLNAAKAKFNSTEVEGQQLKYAQADANFNFTYPFNPTCGLLFGAGWVGTEVNWAQNPDFNETDFNYVNLSFGGFSKAFSNWTWTLVVSAFLDTAEFSLVDYTLYQGILWGKYNWFPCLELDFGFLLEAGLSKDKIWPILGFIYHPIDRLRLHAVYPVDMTLEYDLYPKLTLAGSIRILRNRHRVKDDEPSPQAVFQYQSWGAEFDAQYNPAKWFFVRGFVGSTLGGALRIANRDDKHGRYFKFDPSFYAGASGVFSF